MNTEQQTKTWADHYRDRVGNRDYRNAFEEKYFRFIDEIIFQTKCLRTNSDTPLVLKEEGCGIGSVVRCISEREEYFLKHLGVRYSELEDRNEIEKICMADADKEMLSLCMDNTRNLYLGEYLAGKPIFYSSENILKPKFFEPNTIVVTHGVLEHFRNSGIEKIISTYNDDNVVFQAHYVPTDKYGTPSFGDERLLSVQEWVTLVQPDYYIVDNGGCDLYMFSFSKGK